MSDIVRALGSHSQQAHPFLASILLKLTWLYPRCLVNELTLIIWSIMSGIDFWTGKSAVSIWIFLNLMRLQFASYFVVPIWKMFHSACFNFSPSRSRFVVSNFLLPRLVAHVNLKNSQLPSGSNTLEKELMFAPRRTETIMLNFCPISDKSLNFNLKTSSAGIMLVRDFPMNCMILYPKIDISINPIRRYQLGTKMTNYRESWTFTFVISVTTSKFLSFNYFHSRKYHRNLNRVSVVTMIKSDHKRIPYNMGHILSWTERFAWFYTIRESVFRKVREQYIYGKWPTIVEEIGHFPSVATFWLPHL